MREVVGGLDHWLMSKEFNNAPEPKPRLFDLAKILDLAQGLDSDVERNRLRTLLKQADLKSEVQALARHGTTNDAVRVWPLDGLTPGPVTIASWGLEEHPHSASCRGGPISWRPVDQPHARFAPPVHAPTSA